MWGLWWFKATWKGIITSNWWKVTIKCSRLVCSWVSWDFITVFTAWTLFLFAASRVTVKSGLCAESLEGDSRRHPRMGLTSYGHSLGSEHLTGNYNGPYRKKTHWIRNPFFSLREHCAQVAMGRKCRVFLIETRWKRNLPALWEWESVLIVSRTLKLILKLNMVQTNMSKKIIMLKYRAYYLWPSYTCNWNGQLIWQQSCTSYSKWFSILSAVDCWLLTIIIIK